MGVTKEYCAQSQADAEEVDEEHTLGRAAKYLGNSVVQMVMTNVLDPFSECAGFSPDHPEQRNVSHIEDKNPEDQQR